MAALLQCFFPSAHAGEGTMAAGVFRTMGFDGCSVRVFFACRQYRNMEKEK